MDSSGKVGAAEWVNIIQNSRGDRANRGAAVKFGLKHRTVKSRTYKMESARETKVVAPSRKRVSTPRGAVPVADCPRHQRTGGKGINLRGKSGLQGFPR